MVGGERFSLTHCKLTSFICIWRVRRGDKRARSFSLIAPKKNPFDIHVNGTQADHFLPRKRKELAPFPQMPAVSFASISVGAQLPFCLSPHPMHCTPHSIPLPESLDGGLEGNGSDSPVTKEGGGVSWVSFQAPPDTR